MKPRSRAQPSRERASTRQIAARFKAALALHRGGRLDEARSLYRAILRAQPRHFNALHLLATLAAQQRDSKVAVTLFDRAIRIDPTHADSHTHRGNALLDLRRHPAALASYDRALALAPDCAEAHYNRANALLQCEYHERKSKRFLRELHLRGYPRVAQARHEAALLGYERALELQPDYADAWFNRGNVLYELNRPKAALQSYNRAIALRPDHAESHFNRGNALLDLHRHDAVLRSYDRALQLKPDDAHMHLNRAFVRLLLGDFARGWPENEWRWKRPATPEPQLPRPRWKGEPLTGRTILLHCEQGLGDTLQLVRYARELQRRRARTIVLCQRPLVRILQRCEGIDRVVAEGDPLPEFDFWIPLMSVPTVLRTDHDSIPGTCGYLRAVPGLVRHWKKRLRAIDGFRIGICWQGSPDHQADRQRSTPLRYFAPLARIPGVRLISLQKGPGLAQLDEIAGAFELVQFDDLDTAHGAFMDTAALMRSLDLVVCCDSSLVHLAGALGVPVWLPLPFAPDWRWLLGRTDSPWYPSLRLFRQEALGDWESAFRKVTRALRQQLGRAASTRSHSGIV